MRITKKKVEGLMEETGSCWAYRNDKHESNNSDGKMWHIHPDSSNPHQQNIVMFHTLSDAYEWLQDLELSLERDRLFLDEMENE